MLNSMVMFTFSVLDWKYSICANLAQKIKIDCLRRNLAFTLIRICWCDGDIQIFSMGLQISYLEQCGPESQNRVIKMKLGAWANSNMKNSMVMFLVLFGTENYALGQIWWKKIKIVFFFTMVCDVCKMKQM